MSPRVKARKKSDRRSTPGAIAGDRRRGQDRRQHERVIVSLQVDYRAADTFLFAYIADLSEMGIFIRTNAPHAPGTKLNLSFAPPGQPRLDLEGRVIWVNPPLHNGEPGRNPGMGVQFVDLTVQQRDRLMHLVKTFAYLGEGDTPRGNS